LKAEKEERYLAAARAVFDRDPSVALFIYGHTHIPSLLRIGPHCVVNTGTWLKRVERVKARFRLMPDVYVSSYRLNYFAVSRKDGGIRLEYRIIEKDAPDDLTLLQKLMILGRRRPEESRIPEETIF